MNDIRKIGSPVDSLEIEQNFSAQFCQIKKQL